MNACSWDDEAASACTERPLSAPRRPHLPAPSCPVPTLKVAPPRCSPEWVAQGRAIGGAALSQASGCSLPPAPGPPASPRRHWRHPESSLAPGAVSEPDPDGLTGAVTRAASTMLGGLPIPSLEVARVCSTPPSRAALTRRVAEGRGRATASPREQASRSDSFAQRASGAAFAASALTATAAHNPLRSAGRAAYAQAPDPHKPTGAAPPADLPALFAVGASSLLTTPGPPPPPRPSGAGERPSQLPPLCPPRSRQPLALQRWACPTRAVLAAPATPPRLMQVGGQGGAPCLPQHQSLDQHPTRRGAHPCLGKALVPPPKKSPGWRHSI